MAPSSSATYTYAVFLKVGYQGKVWLKHCENMTRADIEQLYQSIPDIIPDLRGLHVDDLHVTYIDATGEDTGFVRDPSTFRAIYMRERVKFAKKERMEGYGIISSTMIPLRIDVTLPPATPVHGAMPSAKGLETAPMHAVKDATAGARSRARPPLAIGTGPDSADAPPPTQPPSPWHLYRLQQHLVKTLTPRRRFLASKRASEGEAAEGAGTTFSTS
ncbi:hypothetical protein JKP88DRAFT_302837 [Tribonema minus]|uniref:Uncharacterized protein n=1 Tax=Tribonema minus TaxID=303371 RepID=A0A835ZB03_9STRA|nr:hypothetical protein JKP88DRAFT_302837 [Tribonema minus]